MTFTLQFGLPDCPKTLPVCWLLVALKEQVRIIQVLMCECGPVFMFDVHHIFLKVTLERHVDPTCDIIILA
jgi:hypothetical protein